MKKELKVFLILSLCVSTGISFYYNGMRASVLILICLILIYTAFKLNHFLGKKETERAGGIIILRQLIGLIAIFPYIVASFCYIWGLYLFCESIIFSGIEYLIAGIVIFYAYISWVVFRNPNKMT